jgi:hypothetical protein
MANFLRDFTADAHTADGYRNYHSQWLQNVSKTIVLHGHIQNVSAILYKVSEIYERESPMQFHHAVYPSMLTGLILPRHRLALVSPAWKTAGSTDIVIDDAPYFSVLPAPNVYRHLLVAREYLHDLHEFWQALPELETALGAARDTLLQAVAANSGEMAGTSLHTFGSVLSSQGPYSSLFSLPADSIRRTMIISPPASGISEIMVQVGAHAAEHGHTVIFMHNGLDSTTIDHLYLSDKDWLISHNVAPYWRDPSPSDEILDLTEPSLSHHASDTVELLYYLYAQAYHMAWAALACISPPASLQMARKFPGRSCRPCLHENWCHDRQDFCTDHRDV